MEILVPFRRVVRKQILENQVNGDRTSCLGGSWSAYGDGVEDYDDSFREVLGGKDIASIIKTRRSPVVIDLMSPSDRLANLFSQVPNKRKLGIAVSLEDLRSDEKKQADKDMDIRQIAGDILKFSTWREIDQALQDRKADLIIERALDGLSLIPQYKILYGTILRKIWNILSKENGIFLFQVPRESIDMSLWIWTRIFKEYKIDVLGEGSQFMKIVKTPDSPIELPLLR